MRSAFRRGVELLSKSESDSGLNQGKPVERPKQSVYGNMEGIGVLKNVTQLEPVIKKLMRKVIVTDRYLTSLS